MLIYKDIESEYKPTFKCHRLFKNTISIDQMIEFIN